MDTLAFGYILPTTGWIRDFNPLETCAARRTTKKQPAGISPNRLVQLASVIPPQLPPVPLRLPYSEVPDISPGSETGYGLLSAN